MIDARTSGEAKCQQFIVASSALSGRSAVSGGRDPSKLSNNWDK